MEGNEGLFRMREQLKQIYRARLPDITWCDDNTRRKQQVEAAYQLVRSDWEAEAGGYLSVVTAGVEASSTDNEHQTIVNTVPNDRSFWSSTAHDSQVAHEALLYELAAPACRVVAVKLAPYRALYQEGYPVYPPMKLQVWIGSSPYNLQPASPWHDVQASDTLQTFAVWPHAPLGRFLQVRMYGKLQQQREDMRFYVAVRHVDVFGEALPTPQLLAVQPLLRSSSTCRLAAPTPNLPASLTPALQAAADYGLGPEQTAAVAAVAARAAAEHHHQQQQQQQQQVAGQLVVREDALQMPPPQQQQQQQQGGSAVVQRVAATLKSILGRRGAAAAAAGAAADGGGREDEPGSSGGSSSKRHNHQQQVGMPLWLAEEAAAFSVGRQQQQQQGLPPPPRQQQQQQLGPPMGAHAEGAPQQQQQQQQAANASQLQQQQQQQGLEGAEAQLLEGAGGEDSDYDAFYDDDGDSDYGYENDGDSEEEEEEEVAMQEQQQEEEEAAAMQEEEDGEGGVPDHAGLARASAALMQQAAQDPAGEGAAVMRELADRMHDELNLRLMQVAPWQQEQMLAALLADDPAGVAAPMGGRALWGPQHQQQQQQADPPLQQPQQQQQQQAAVVLRTPPVVAILPSRNGGRGGTDSSNTSSSGSSSTSRWCAVMPPTTSSSSTTEQQQHEEGSATTTGLLVKTRAVLDQQLVAAGWFHVDSLVDAIAGVDEEDMRLRARYAPAYRAAAAAAAGASAVVSTAAAYAPVDPEAAYGAAGTAGPEAAAAVAGDGVELHDEVVAQQQQQQEMQHPTFDAAAPAAPAAAGQGFAGASRAVSSVRPVVPATQLFQWRAPGEGRGPAAAGSSRAGLGTIEECSAMQAQQQLQWLQQPCSCFCEGMEADAQVCF